MANKYLGDFKVNGYNYVSFAVPRAFKLLALHFATKKFHKEYLFRGCDNGIFP